MDHLAEMSRPMSTKGKSKIAESILKRPILMRRLVSLFLGDDYRTTQNAASTIAERNGKLLTPHLAAFVLKAGQLNANDAVKRNVMRLLQFTPLPLKHHDRIGALGFRLFENRREAVAIHVFAMTVLARLAEFYPEMKPALQDQIAVELPYGSAGFVSRGAFLIRELNSGNAAKP
jgi:hypothetical protein